MENYIKNEITVIRNEIHKLYESIYHREAALEAIRLKKLEIENEEREFQSIVIDERTAKLKAVGLDDNMISAVLRKEGLLLSTTTKGKDKNADDTTTIDPKTRTNYRWALRNKDKAGLPGGPAKSLVTSAENALALGKFEFNG